MATSSLTGWVLAVVLSSLALAQTRPNRPAPRNAPPSTPAAATSSDSIPVTPADRANAVAPVLGEIPDMKLSIAKLPPMKWRLNLINLAGGSGEFFEAASRLLLPDGGETVATISLKTQKPAEVGEQRVLRIDLRTGASAGAVMKLPGNLAILDLSTDGKTLLTRRDDFHHGEKNRLDVWTVAADPKHRVSFVPYPDVEQNESDIRWARMLSGDELLTCSGDYRVTAWSIAQDKPVAKWEIKSEYWIVPTVDATATHVFVWHKDMLVAHKTEDATAVGCIRAPGENLTSISITPSGRELAVFGVQHIRLWSLETGALVQEFVLPTRLPANGIQFVSDDLALLGNRYLFDLRNRVVFWEYTNMIAPEATGAMGGSIWVVGDPGQKKWRLLPIEVPHFEAQKIRAKLSPDALALFKPGDKVSIDLRLDYPPDQLQQIRAAQQAALEARGLVVADGAALKLCSDLVPQQPVQVEYNFVGRGAHKVTITPNQMRVWLELDGKKSWENVAVGGAPMMLMVRKDQTVEQAIAEAVRDQWQFFSRVSVPGWLPKPRDALAYGSSTISVTGVK